MGPLVHKVCKGHSDTAVGYCTQVPHTKLYAGKLVGKPVSFFVSTATQGGGQETTIMTALTQVAHHGMIYIPPGYTHGPPMHDMSTVRAGSAWGAGCFAAADGSRQPSAPELAYAKHQGEYFAGKAVKLAK
jgi:NAD(P)H dehydrogenase (quinone)